jgi:hypothetical protein
LREPMPHGRMLIVFWRALAGFLSYVYSNGAHREAAHIVEPMARRWLRTRRIAMSVKRFVPGSDNVLTQETDNWRGNAAFRGRSPETFSCMMRGLDHVSNRDA